MKHNCPISVHYQIAVDVSEFYYFSIFNTSLHKEIKFQLHERAISFGWMCLGRGEVAMGRRFRCVLRKGEAPYRSHVVFLSPDTQGREVSKSSSSKERKALCPQFTLDIVITKNLLTVCKAAVFKQKHKASSITTSHEDKQMLLGP